MRSGLEIHERWAPVFPTRTTKMLRYSTNFNIGATAGVVSSYVFVANGLFDPDFTGTGHQPMGFDQLMLSYNHYTVLDSRILVTFRNLGGLTTTVALTSQANSAPITNIDQILEFGLNNSTTLEGKSISGDVAVLEERMNIRKFVGVDDPLDSPDLSGAVASNPLESEFFHVQCWDTVGNTTSVHCNVVIEFRATFTEPRVLTPSLTAALKRLVLQETKSTLP